MQEISLCKTKSRYVFIQPKNCLTGEAFDRLVLDYIMISNWVWAEMDRHGPISYLTGEQAYFSGNLMHISKHEIKHNFRVKMAFSLSISTLNLDHFYAYKK